MMYCCFVVAVVVVFPLSSYRHENLFLFYICFRINIKQGSKLTFFKTVLKQTWNLLVTVSKYVYLYILTYDDINQH